jgi:hypothetical protein
MQITAFPSLLSALLLVVAPAASGGARQAPRATLDDVAWMQGTWLSSTGGRTVEEHWTSPGGGAMFAISRTLKGDRLIEFEYLRIVQREGGLVYVAQPNGKPPTDFPLTRLEGRSVTFENPDHDFPKVIRYAAREDGSLEASVSGGPGQRTLSWIFAHQP